MSFAHPLWALAVLPVWLAAIWRELRLEASPARRGARIAVRSLVLALLALALAGPSLVRREALRERLLALVDCSQGMSAAGRGEARALLEAARGQAAGRDPGRARVRGFAAALGAEMGLEEALASGWPLETARAASPAEPPPAAQARVATALAAARAAFAPSEHGRVLLLLGPEADLEGLGELARELARASVGLEVHVLPEAEAPPTNAPRVLALAAPQGEVRGAFEVRADVRAPPQARARLLADGRLLAEQEVPPPDAGGAQALHFDGLELPPGRHLLALALSAPPLPASPGGWPAPTPGEPTPSPAAPTSEPPTLDLALAEVQVGTSPKLLMALADPARNPLVAAAQAQGFEVTLATSAALPAHLAEGAPGQHALVLDAPTAAALPHDVKQRIALLVEAGLGLFVAAGDEPLAWAALAGTPLGHLLPVEPLAPPPAPPPPPPPPAPPPDPTPPPPVDPPEPTPGPGLKAERQPEEALPISLLLVLDQSASMRGGPWAMALEAAERAARVLSPFDRVGVLTFGEDARLELAMGPVLTAGAVGLHLPAEATGRGTNLVLALRKSAEVMRSERSPIRHVILLTDGMHNPTGMHNEQALWSAVVKPLAELGVTLTVVGLGEGHDAKTLSEIAHWAPRGHYRRADSARQVPTIFVVDTQGVARARSKEARARLPDPDSKPLPTPDPPPTPPPAPPTPPPAPPQPPARPPSPPPAPPAAASPALAPVRLVTPHPATRGLEADALPKVEEPLRSGPRAASAVLLARTPEATVLAARRFGVGRVLAWAARGKDKGLATWPDLGRLLGQALRSLLAPEGAFEERLAPRLVATAEGDRLDLSGLAGGSGGGLLVTWRTSEQPVREVARVEQPEVEGPVLLPAAPRGSLAHVEVHDAQGRQLAALTYAAGKSEATRDSAAARADVQARLLGVDPPRAPRAIERTLDLLPWLALLALLLLPPDAFLHRR